MSKLGTVLNIIIAEISGDLTPLQGLLRYCEYDKSGDGVYQARRVLFPRLVPEHVVLIVNVCVFDCIISIRYFRYLLCVIQVYGSVSQNSDTHVHRFVSSNIQVI